MFKKILYSCCFFAIILSSFIEAKSYILLMGSPASGKGTFADCLMQSGTFEHLCLGDLLRNEIAKESELGKTIKDCVEQGQLVPSQLVLELFETYFAKHVVGDKGIIIDGMVQSLENVFFFDQLIEKYALKDNLYYIYLNIDYETAIERLLTRLICKNCQKVFNKKDQIICCPICQEALVQRIDDKEKTILTRVNRFFESTLYLIDYYRARPNFHEFDGTCKREDLIEKYKLLFFK